MSAERYTFDTNILFYAIDSVAGEKHHIASRLLGEADYYRAILLLQTLGELCNSVQKKRPAAMPRAESFAAGNAAMFEVVHAIPSDLADALEARRHHNLSLWDAMLWATTRRAGCTLLLTEDFQHGRSLGGVAFQNPFLLSKKELSLLLE